MIEPPLSTTIYPSDPELCKGDRVRVISGNREGEFGIVTIGGPSPWVKLDIFNWAIPGFFVVKVEEADGS